MILALRALGVGDLATAVPALRGLRVAYRADELVLAAPGWLAPLVDLVGVVDRLLPVAGLDPGGWPATGEKPRLAVNLHGRGPRSHRLLRVAQPARLIAFQCPAAGHREGPPWIEEEHEVRRWCRLLHWYGVPADPADLALRRPPADSVTRGVTVVHPGGKEAQRRWCPQRFAAVARQLARTGHRVVVTGSAPERELAERVAASAGLSDANVLAGRVDVGELAALVAHARLVISADTGVGHLATAYGTPSVLLFGPVPPWRWGPPAERPWHRVLWHERLATASGPPSPAPTNSPAPYAQSAVGGLHPALAAIGVRQVLDAAAEAERVGQARHIG